MKYIDVDKLKVLLSDIKEEYNYCKGDFHDGIVFAINELEEEINDSLQQEQDCIVINKKDWEAQEQFKKNKDFGKPLKEEQPKKSKKDCNGCPHCVDRKDQYGWHFKGCFGGPYKGKFIAEIDECPLEQEHSEMDLEKEISTWIPAHIRGGDNEVWKDTKKAVTEWGGIVARHFYELGKNARKE